jgi:hypothetical protein
MKQMNKQKSVIGILRVSGVYEINVFTNAIWVKVKPSFCIVELLMLRDQAWRTCFKNFAYLDSVKKKLNLIVIESIEDMTSIPLKCRILGDWVN